MSKVDVFCLENVVWIAATDTNVPAYDFNFSAFFDIRRPYDRPGKINCIGRFGAVQDYKTCFSDMIDCGIELVHAPEMHALSSELTEWYPLIENLTPFSKWFQEPPSVAEVEAFFSWPVFIKGSRQTSRHQAELAIIRSADHYIETLSRISKDPILKWQKLVVREFVRLQSVGETVDGKIPPSFEYRTFWWKGECVGEGRYHTNANYKWTEAERSAAIILARKVVEAIDVTFLVIDLAKTEDGNWTVIELNDGQESGYAGVPPTALWQNISEIEKRRTAQ